MISNSNEIIPVRGLINNHKNGLGFFSIDEISELEEMLNSKSIKEIDFQNFFVKHPHFLRLGDYRQVYPHVHLEKKYIPDFILTNRELQKAAIVELKLPYPKLVTRKKNRERFSYAIWEARAQLLTYQKWFRDKYNRNKLLSAVNMPIYEPKLIVVIGRSDNFFDSFNRQQLSSDMNDIDVYTFDDILNLAKERILLMGNRNYYR